MAMNSPSGPTEATRNASMMSGMMAARDREKTLDSLDERERDRLAQKSLPDGSRTGERRSLIRRLLDRLPFG